MIRRLVCILLLQLLAFSVTGQHKDRDVYLQQIQQFFDGGKLSYSYNLHITQTDVKNARTLTGRIHKADQRFYDSCDAYIKMSNNGYILQLDKQRKHIILVNVAQYKSLMGAEDMETTSNTLLQIPMEALDTATTFKMTSNGAEQTLQFEFLKNMYGFKYITFLMKGKEVKQVEMSMKGTDRWGDATSEMYTIKLYNFSRSVNEAVFDHRRFYTIKSGKVSYATPYKAYTSYELL